jgi:hypothetical protein
MLKGRAAVIVKHPVYLAAKGAITEQQTSDILFSVVLDN